MGNTIETIKKYVPLLDKKYAVETKSAVLDVQNDLIKETANAKSVLVPKMTLQGLGDYDRSNGYVNGNATLEWVTHTFTQDRGRSFQIDNMDNEETAMVAFGSLSGEFIRTKVAPEVDAYRFSTYATKATNKVEETLTKDTVITAIDTAIATLDDAEVPETDRVLFVSIPTYNLMKNSAELVKRFDVQTSNGNIDRRIETFDGMQIVKVPTARFKTAYTFKDGKTAGQEDGGFTPATEAVAINFMIVSKTAVVQLVKLALPRVFSPDVNQDANAWKFDYRLYHDAWVLDNKIEGIYVSTVPAV
ncbi:MAG: hypothetical protein ACFWUA_05190 [Sporanaerobacter sp.]|jgi:hypothetical protein|uniref:hypothetical protein n=1 Tax=Sporanaerobacter sp. TaxID=2010183 RepID=UPI003A0FC196